MLSVDSLTYDIGGRTLYEDISFQIKPKEKVALVGLNGTGKSTLCKLITGSLTPQRGKISFPKDASIGFLHQDLLTYKTDKSIKEVALDAFKEQLHIQQEIDQLLKQLEQDSTDTLLEKLSHLQDRFAQLGGYDMESQAEQLLEKMGFKTEDIHRPFNEFSGGWRMRVIFTQLLLSSPDLLILDEPTNHLDIVAIEWIEQYLRKYQGAVLLISHDRQFLDHITGKTLEIVDQKVHSYAGNYSFYEEEKAKRSEIQQKAFANQQKKIKQTERFIERFRAKSSKASLVQSRIKALERMDKVSAVIEDNRRMKVRFSIEKTPGKDIVRIQGLSKSFDTCVLFDQADAYVERGDKIALLGANGKGKSTLLKLIAGISESDAGEIKFGHHVMPAFYAQHQVEDLNLKNTVFEELQQAGSKADDAKLRAILGAFLFQKDEVKKIVQVLSGGEKARVALAKMLAKAPNFLLLDEPTNHLDMRAVDVLAQALQNYDGTLIVVSHNRHFIQQIANQVWSLEHGKIKVFKGGYKDYHDWQKQRMNASALH